jgi:hypothetical protein
MANHCSRGFGKRLWYRYCVKRAMLTRYTRLFTKPKTLAEERLIEQKWLKTPFNAGVLFQLICI